jgi:hypothetical protein
MMAIACWMAVNAILINRQRHKKSTSFRGSKVRSVDNINSSNRCSSMYACIFESLRHMLISTSFYRTYIEKELRESDTSDVACYFLRHLLRFFESSKAKALQFQHRPSKLRGRLRNSSLRQRVARVRLSFFDCLRKAFEVRCWSTTAYMLVIEGGE